MTNKNPWNKGIKGAINSGSFKKGHKTNLGKIRSEEVRKNLSIARLGENNPMFGTKHSEEHKDKIRKSMIGKNTWMKGRHTPQETIDKIKDTWNKDDRKQKARERIIKQVFPMEDTSIEKKIQGFLKQMNIEFLTHQYMRDIAHGYKCDILIPSMNLIIECDGNYWHKYPLGNELDIIHSNELREKGHKVIRLWESEIKPMMLFEFSNLLEKVNER